eukprot:m.219308 g.219308  ORF g.219308 m.219308 type:complete len:150 (+) comp39921_c0_seq28:1054-1503(+)
MRLTCIFRVFDFALCGSYPHNRQLMSHHFHPHCPPNRLINSTTISAGNVSNASTCLRPILRCQSLFPFSSSLSAALMPPFDVESGRLKLRWRRMPILSPVRTPSGTSDAVSAFCGVRRYSGNPSWSSLYVASIQINSGNALNISFIRRS